MKCTLTSAPLVELSTDPVWLRYLSSATPPLHYYRAVPILRENTTAGLIISFFADHRTCQAEALLLSPGAGSPALPPSAVDSMSSSPSAPSTIRSPCLLNRASLYEHLDLQLFRPDLKDRLALVYIDLDGFKEINDCYGHATGDKVLQYVSRRILESIRHTDIAARIGGDEFVVILPGVAERSEARRIADLILNAIAQPASFDGRELHVGASCGISLYPRDGTDSEAILKAADEDMYKIKIRNRHKEVLLSA